MDKKLKTILFVEEDESMSLVTKWILEHMQISEEVISFSDSQKALQFLKERYRAVSEIQDHETHDLVLLDIDKGGFGGFELLYILRGLERMEKIHLKNTHFALMVSSLSPGITRNASLYHTLGVLEKPLQEQRIRDLIDKIR